MKEIVKPTRVLCKRTSAIGKPFWWDDYVEPPGHKERHDHDNRDLVEGDWYDVVENKNDVWDTDKDKYTFTIINNQGNKSLHYMYTDEQRANFPDHCDIFGPRDYSKWFYTPEELEQLEAGTYKMSYKEKHGISVFPGNYHWVKQKDEDGGKWIIAQCRQKNRLKPGTHFWDIMGNSGYCPTDDDFAEIGHEVDSMETQEHNKERLKDYKELNDTLFPMIDSLKAQGTEDEKFYPPLEYHKPLVEKAINEYFDKSFARISNDSLFFGEDGNKKIEL